MDTVFHRAQCRAILICALVVTLATMIAGETGAALDAILIGWLAYVVHDLANRQNIQAYRPYPMP